MTARKPNPSLASNDCKVCLACMWGLTIPKNIIGFPRSLTALYTWILSWRLPEMINVSIVTPSLGFAMTESTIITLDSGSGWIIVPLDMYMAGEVPKYQLINVMSHAKQQLGVKTTRFIFPSPSLARFRRTDTIEPVPVTEGISLPFPV